MPRTRATFDWTYRLAGRQLHGDADWFDLHYLPGAVRFYWDCGFVGWWVGWWSMWFPAQHQSAADCMESMTPVARLTRPTARPPPPLLQ